MPNVRGRRERSGLPWWGAATVGLLALAVVSGCGDAASEGSPATSKTVAATGDADESNLVDVDDRGNVLTVRPVSSSGPSGQNQVDCAANAALDDGADAPLIVCDAAGDEVFYLEPAIITDNGVRSAQSHQNPQTGSFIVMLEFASDAEQRLQTFTSEHEGTALAFVVDGTVLSAPIIRDASQGKVMIAGDFSESEARALADRLS